MGVFKRRRKSEDGSKAAFWYIRYAVNGKIKWEAVDKSGVVTKDVALRRLANRKQQIQLRQVDEIGVQIPNLSELTVNYIKHQRDIKQKRSWKKDIAHLKRWNAVFGSRKLSEISAKDIDDYKLKRLAEVKPATVNRELEVLSHFFTNAERTSRERRRQGVRVEQEVRHLCSLDETQDKDQEYRANGCHDDGAEQAPTQGHTQGAKQEPTKQRAQNANDDIPNDTEAAAFHELPRKPPRHQPDQDKPDKLHDSLLPQEDSIIQRSLEK